MYGAFCCIHSNGLFRKYEGAAGHYGQNWLSMAIAGSTQHVLELPWSIGVTLLRPHLMNRLVKRGYNYNEVTAKLNRAVKRYDNEINEIFLELIS